MNTYKSNGISTPTNNDDASNKNSTDMQAAKKLNIDGTNAMTEALNMNSKNINNGALITTANVAVTSTVANGTPCQLTAYGSINIVNLV